MYGPQGQNQALVMVVLKFTYRNYPIYKFSWLYHQLQQLPSQEARSRLYHSDITNKSQM